MVQTHVIASVLGCMVNAWGASSFGMFSQGRFAGTRLSATIMLVLGKLQNKARNNDDCEPNKVVTFKSPTGTGTVGYGVTKEKPPSYPKTNYPGKYPGTDNNIIKTVMGSGPRKEKTSDKSEK